MKLLLVFSCADGVAPRSTFVSTDLDLKCPGFYFSFPFFFYYSSIILCLGLMIQSPQSWPPRSFSSSVYLQRPCLLSSRLQSSGPQLYLKLQPLSPRQNPRDFKVSIQVPPQTRPIHGRTSALVPAVLRLPATSSAIFHSFSTTPLNRILIMPILPVSRPNCSISSLAKWDQGEKSRRPFIHASTISIRSFTFVNSKPSKLMSIMPMCVFPLLFLPRRFAPRCVKRWSIAKGALYGEHRPCTSVINKDVLIQFAVSPTHLPDVDVVSQDRNRCPCRCHGLPRSVNQYFCSVAYFPHSLDGFEQLGAQLFQGQK